MIPLSPDALHRGFFLAFPLAGAQKNWVNTFGSKD